MMVLRLSSHYKNCRDNCPKKLEAMYVFNILSIDGSFTAMT